MENFRFELTISFIIGFNNYFVDSRFYATTTSSSATDSYTFFHTLPLVTFTPTGHTARQNQNPPSFTEVAVLQQSDRAPIEHHNHAISTQIRLS
ncbi:hypothetical protein TSMEX_001443 [Taenia solium]|eukprot:TsM_000268200 transcript=TsM_000268200 gene=TsM_000268200